MQREKIYISRITNFSKKIQEKRYSKLSNLNAEFIYDAENPIPYSEALIGNYKEIKLDEKWGDLWGSAWFKFVGQIPEKAKGKEIAAIINTSSEACLWKDGSPSIGLTNKIHWYLNSTKEFIPITSNAKGNEKIDLLIEAGANGLFGSAENDYKMKTMELVEVHKDVIQLCFDFDVLISLMETLEEKTPRRNKIMFGLNEVCNLWQEGNNISECLKITKQILSQKANASSLTAYSIGHAHLDLAWLWPIRETRRKGGRTFSTALKMIEEYPDYKFGASQPQLYEWVKKDYPGLFSKVKQAVKDKKWEVQGAMWVEPDMNLAGGESLVRQCLIGKQFYQDEFGIEVNDLWLPDVFGYSAALPQILKKCRIDYFMTQKISWNETNVFPHHTFMWEGIDGTKILTHFLPTNNYNLSNTPKELIESEKRYAQSDVSDEFLNLYGIGDGGGGPSRHHIELGLRQQDLEGVPKVKFSFAQDFYKKIDQIPKEVLPKWKGELYLELHRGTYTTQALMKKHNRQLEQKLHNVEFIGSLVSDFEQNELTGIWKDTLLNQFHDILPGSSINWVYKDANKLSKENLDKLAKIENGLFSKLHAVNNSKKYMLFYNTQSWKRNSTITIAIHDGIYLIKSDNNEQIVESQNGNIVFNLEIPAYGYSAVEITKTEKLITENSLNASSKMLENTLLKICFADDGTINSIYDKELEREMLKGNANQFLLWEDEPNNWGAWDINHFYLETKPEKAKLIEAKLESCSAKQAIILQKFSIGNSSIIQRVILNSNSKLISFENEVDWKEEHKMLRVSAQPDVYSQNASFEIQYGTLQRPTHSNTSWDAAKFEVVAHRFADLSQEKFGFAIINDCKYGHYVQDNIMSLNLLRSPKDTDKEADLHKHNFKFGYYPHKGDLNQSDTLQQAHFYNSPIIPIEVKELPESLTKSHYSIRGNNVKLEVVKKAEREDAIILRLYEFAGSESKINLDFEQEFNEIFETDMLEKNLNLIASNKKSIKLRFSPFEIKTLKLKK